MGGWVCDFCVRCRSCDANTSTGKIIDKSIVLGHSEQGKLVKKEEVKSVAEMVMEVTVGAVGAAEAAVNATEVPMETEEEARDVRDLDTEEIVANDKKTKKSKKTAIGPWKKKKSPKPEAVKRESKRDATTK